MILEPKHLFAYAPYGVHCQVWQHIVGYKNRKLSFDSGHDFYNKLEEGLVRLFLHPLSDLTKEIEVNGEKFIPMIKLLTLIDNCSFSKDENVRLSMANSNPKIIECTTNSYRGINAVDHTVKFLVVTENMGDLVHSFSYNEEFDRFSKRDETRSMSLGVGYQVQLFEKLKEWHFDIFGLIDSGLAVDINTVTF